MVGRVFLSLIIIIVCTLGASAQAGSDLTQSRILILLDGSSSMIHKWKEGKEKFKAAGELIGKLMDSVYAVNDQVEFSLRVFGHQHTLEEDYCYDTKNEVPFAKDNRLQMALRLASLQPLGVTPIAYALQQAAENDLVDESHNAYSIILITDGGESCGGDICEVMQTLIRNKVYFKPYILSLEDDPQLRTTYSCMGDYLQVTKTEDMSRAVGVIVDAFKPMLKITNADFKKIQTSAVRELTKPVDTGTLPTAVKTWREVVHIDHLDIAPQIVLGITPEEVTAEFVVPGALPPVKKDPIVHYTLATLSVAQFLGFTPDVQQPEAEFIAMQAPKLEIKTEPLLEHTLLTAAPLQKAYSPLLPQVGLPNVEQIDGISLPPVKKERVADHFEKLATTQEIVLPLPPLFMQQDEVNIAPDLKIKREHNKVDLTGLTANATLPQEPIQDDTKEIAVQAAVEIKHDRPVVSINTLVPRGKQLVTTKPENQYYAAPIPLLPPVRREIVRDATQLSNLPTTGLDDIAAQAPKQPDVAAVAEPVHALTIDTKPERQPAHATKLAAGAWVHLSHNIPAARLYVATTPKLPQVKKDAPKKTAKQPAVADKKNAIPPEKRAEVRTETEDAKETTLQVYFTDGKGKFYQSTPQVVLIDPVTNQDVKAFYRTVDANGNPDAQPDILPGTYNISFSAKRNMLAASVVVEKNKNNKVYITVKNTNLTFIYGGKLDRPVSEFFAVVTERDKANGRVQKQKCTEKMEYEPGNYHIEINTFPRDVRNVDLDLDGATAITILQPGFLKLTNLKQLKSVELFTRVGDRFLRYCNIDLADPQTQHLQIQPGEYQVHYTKGPIKSYASEAVLSFTIKPAEETEVVIQ